MAERRLVKVVLDAEVERYIRDMDRAAAATSKLAGSGGGGAGATREATRANKDLAASAKTAQTATLGLASAETKSAEAALRIVQAENRAKDATDRHLATRRALIAALKSGDDSKIASARQRDTKALRDMDVASQSLAITTTKLAAANDQAGASFGKTERVSKQTSLTFGQMALAAGAIGPAMIPIAAGAGAAGLALGGMGAAGILALVGIKREMEQGTALGRKFEAGLADANDVLTVLSRTAAAGVLPGFQESVADLQSRMPQLNSLVGSLATSLGSSAAPALRGLLNLVELSGPLMMDGARGAQQMAQAFEKWSQSDGAEELIGYLRANLPEVAATIGNVVQAAGKLIQAIAPLGGASLAAINALASAINALSPEQLRGLATAALAVGAAMKTWRGASLVASTFGTSIGRAGRDASTAASGVNTFATAADKGQRSAGLLGKAGKTGALGLLAIGSVVTKSGTQIENYGRSTAQLESDMEGLGGTGRNLDGIFRDLQVGMSPDKTYSLADGFKKLEGEGAGVDRVLGNIATGFGTFGTGATTNMQAIETRVNAVGDSLGKMVEGGQADEAKQIFDAMSKEANKAGISTERLRQLMPGYTSAVKNAANAQQRHAQYLQTARGQVESFRGALGTLGGAHRTLGGSILQARVGTYDFYDALGKARSALEANGRTLNLNTAAGRSNREMLDGLATAGVKQAQATFTATGSIGKATAQLNQGRKAFIDMAVGMGMPTVAAKKLADQMFVLRDKAGKPITTDITLRGATQAYHDIDKMGNALFRLQGHPGVKLRADMPGAAAVIKALDGIDAKAVSANNKSVTVQAYAPLADGVVKKLEKLSGVAVSANGKKITVNTSAPGAAESVRKVNDLVTKATAAGRIKPNVKTSTNAARTGTLLESAATRARDLARQKPSVKTSTNAARTGTQLDNARTQAQSLDRQSPNVKTSTNAPSIGSMLSTAMGQAQSLDRQSPTVTGSTNAPTIGGQIAAAMAQAKDKSHTITTKRTTIISTIRRGLNSAVSGLFDADGSLTTGSGRTPIPATRAGVLRFANGGVEDHRAQIAPAGAWRVWAEPETGGEAYIPLAASKRARSERILEETARIFGKQVVARADGAVDYARSAPTANLAAMRAYTAPARQTITVNSSGIESQVAALSRTVAVLAERQDVPVHATIEVDSRVLATATARGQKRLRA